MKKIELKAKIKEALAQAVEYLGLAKVIFIGSCISFVFSALDVYLDEKIYEELTLAFLMGTTFAIKNIYFRFLLQGPALYLDFFLTGDSGTRFTRSFIILESFVPPY